MFSPMFSILIIPFLAAMFLAINMGGSGTSPSFAAAYGADIVRKDVIPILFGAFVFLGAILAGRKVALTIGKDILPEEVMGLTLTTIILLSVSASLLMANLLKIPQSTSQATVFALVGPAIYFNILKTDKLFSEIVPSWFILPLVSFLVTLFAGKFVYKAAIRRGTAKFQELSRHPLLKVIVISASCYVAFAIGSNNVANAAAPIASMVLNELKITPSEENSLLIMILTVLLIAPCFGIGSSILGRGVVRTTGKDIVDIGPVGATFVSIVTASLLLVASVTKGVPASLVQLNTAAIIGLGICKTGYNASLARPAVRRLLSVWIIAPTMSLGLSFLFTVIANGIGLL